MQKNLTV